MTIFDLSALVLVLPKAMLVPIVTAIVHSEQSNYSISEKGTVSS
jgi:hypothetical protein